MWKSRRKPVEALQRALTYLAVLHSSTGRGDRNNSTVSRIGTTTHCNVHLSLSMTGDEHNRTKSARGTAILADIVIIIELSVQPRETCQRRP
jgi:hypothetical protein